MVKKFVVTKWLASLSDGSTAIQYEEPFTDTPGGSSAWGKLKAHLKENDFRITGLRLQVAKYRSLHPLVGAGEPIRTYNIPSLAVDQTPGIFQALKPKTPVSFRVGRRVAIEKSGAGEVREVERYAMIRACYENFSVSLFVDEYEGNESWVVVHENKKS